MLHCDQCQRIGGISRRNEMPLQNILEVEVFDCWGIDFVGGYIMGLLISAKFQLFLALNC